MPRGSDIGTLTTAAQELQKVEGASGPVERQVLIAAIWSACVAFVCGLTIADPDLWGHTLYGLRAIEAGAMVETQDPFSYTAAGRDWINHEWLSESQFGWLWQQFGNVGLIAWRNAWCLVVFAVALAAMKRSSTSLPAIVLLLVLNAETLSDFMVFVRPQMATFGLFAVYLYLLKRFQTERRAALLLPLPLLMVLWVNHHGGFLAGLGVFGVSVLAMGIQSLKDRSHLRSSLVAGAVLCVAILATFVNPYGVGLHQMLWSHLWTPQFVREWQPLWSVNQSPVYYVPFLVTGLALGGSKRWTLQDALILAVVAWQAVSHVRHVSLFCIATMVLLPEPLSDVLSRMFPTIARQWSGEARRPLRVIAVASVILFLSVIHIRGSLKLWQRGITPLSIAAETRSDVPGIPLGAISFINSQQLSGNLLTDYGWGQYVIWHLHPRIRVAFDGRYRTVYPADVEKHFLDFQSLKPDDEAHVAILDDYGTDIVLLPNDRGPLEYMEHRSDWQLVYRDVQASVFLHETPRYQRPIDDFKRLPASETGLAVWTEFPAGPAQVGKHTQFDQTEFLARQRTTYEVLTEEPESFLPSES